MVNHYYGKSYHEILDDVIDGMIIYCNAYEKNVLPETISTAMVTVGVEGIANNIPYGFPHRDDLIDIMFKMNEAFWALLGSHPTTYKWDDQLSLNFMKRIRERLSASIKYCNLCGAHTIIAGWIGLHNQYMVCKECWSLYWEMESGLCKVDHCIERSIVWPSQLCNQHHLIHTIKEISYKV